ncbi:hypothetical protein JCM11641_007977 [Rhodosporidiobolus odoratus]
MSRRKLQYLFAAIDARQSRAREGARAGSVNGRLPRQRYHPDELKRLVVEASEAVDDKSAANDFQETLERIVNEIKNTTEHSTPFLQKVRKADVPDYYDVIKRPMDLATLLKKVKQQTYRTKKAFADDIDLIWSNCLLYNSHPNHPLRHSAEALRAKSNQLLEFITDPAVTQRTFLAASISSAALDGRRASSTRLGTPEEDGDADGESDDERRSKRGISERLLNGANGDYRDSSASPAPSRSATPATSRRFSRKISHGPLGRISPSPEPPSRAELPFEEQPALIRTSEGMNSFLLLDAELCKLEGRSFKSSSASSANILPAVAFDPSSSASTSTKGKSRLVSRIRQLNPSLLPNPPATSSQAATNGHSAHGSSVATPAAILPPPVYRNPDEPLEAIWWDVVASTSSSSNLFLPSPHPSVTNGTNGATNGTNGIEERRRDAAPLPAMVSGMPRVPWVGYVATPYETGSTITANGKVDQKGKGKAVKGEVERKRRKRSKPASEEEKGLAERMRKNCETLQKIRNVGAQLAEEGGTGESVAPKPTSSESDVELPNTLADVMEVDDAGAPVKKRPRVARQVAVSTTIPRKAFRCAATAPTAASEGLRAAAAGTIGHAGFEGTSAASLDVLTHLAGEYLTNLGRTLRFYSDRYGADLAPKQMLTRTLAENGVPFPAVLSSYVSDDIDRYGTRLSDLLRRLERAREEQLDTAADAPDAGAAAEAELLRDDAMAFASDNPAEEVAEDSPWLRKGGTQPGTTDVAGTLTYSPPPAFVPLIRDAISSQIGLLQPYYALRASKPDLGLHDDATLSALNPNPGRSKGSTRHKVPPNGRIPFKGKKRPEDPTLPAAMAAALVASAGEPTKKKKKKKAAASGAASGDSGAE